jgi:hypothetical protein
MLAVAENEPCQSIYKKDSRRLKVPDVLIRHSPLQDGAGHNRINTLVPAILKKHQLKYQKAQKE